MGLMAALTLSQYTARYAGLSPEAVWNAGTTAIVSAFVVSRLLLVAFNFHSFLQYPLLVLALPSLTNTGVLLTLVFMRGYIRWQKIAPLPLLDAFAPCAALLWAFLNLGRYVEGARDGMPTNLALKVRDTMSGAVHPVEIYALIISALFCLLLLRILRARCIKGQTASIALVSSGLAIFFLDFLSLPSNLLPNSILDPSQIIGMIMILVGASLLMRARAQVKRESGNKAPHAI